MISRTPPGARGSAVVTESIVIGWVEFLRGDERLKAELRRDGVWTCAANAELAEILNRYCSPNERPHDEERFGHDELIAAAHRLRGVAWLGEDSVSTGDI
jgi:hypothetical protein